MENNFIKLFNLIILLGSSSLIAEPNEVSPQVQSESAFYLESGLVDKIHKRNTANLERNNRSVLLTGLGYATFSDFKVKNEYFETDYANEVGSIPVIEVMFVKEQYSWRNISLNMTGGVGYSLFQRTLRSRSSDDVYISDNVTTQWMPVHMGSSITYNHSKFFWIKPSIDFAAGTNWIHQSGNVDGMDHSQWTPDLQVGISFLCFSSGADGNFGFSGINVGYSRIVSYNSKSKFVGRRVSIGTSIVL